MSGERDLGREQTAMSLGGRTAASPEALALVLTQAPSPALDRTHVPLPPAFDRTLTPVPDDLARTATPLPPSLARTQTPPPDDGRTSSLVVSTRHGDDEGRPALPVPVQDEDRRVKELVKARLFRSKARPVTIGRFTVLDRLGEGGMGIVYTAYDDQLDRKVAVKVLRGEATRQDEVGRTRLLREAQAMAKLSHANIATVHEVGDLGDQVFIAMEFIRGASLDVWLRGETKRSWREVLEVFCKAGRGLEAAHRAGIVHRDFKPHNVLVGEDGAVKVLDFGLARAAEHAGSEELAVTPQSGAYNNNLLETPLTRTGAIMGTPAYMAPEQHLGGPASAQSDQFSFCVALYEGLYGAHPFDCSTLGALIAGVSAGKIKEAPAASRVPGWLRRVLLRGLAVEPARRHPSMGALLAELAKDPAAQRRRWLASAGLAGVVGAAGFGAASIFTGAPATCQGAAEELAQVWGAERSEAVRAAILASGVPYAADTWARVQPRLDAYAAEWTAMRTEACETHRSGAQSDQLFDLRTACLDQRLASMTALVDVFAGADAAVVEKAVSAAVSLPPLVSCRDTQALTQSVPPPDDPEKSRRVVEIRAALARVKAQGDAGLIARARAGAESLVTEAEALGYPPLVAEVLLRKGVVAMMANDAVTAHSDLDAAMRAGIASKHDMVAAEAGSHDLLVRAEMLLRHDEALQDVPTIAALVERTGPDPQLQGVFLNSRGMTRYCAGERSQALIDAKQAVELKRRFYGEGHPEIAFTLSNIGLILVEERKLDEAIDNHREALRLAKGALGDQHPVIASIDHNLGYALRQQGKYSTARELISHALAVYEANGGARAESTFFLLELAAASISLRDFERAAHELELGRVALREEAGDNKMLTALLHEHSGDLAQGVGDLDSARAEHRRMTELRAEVYGAEHVDVAYSQHRFGEMLLRAGRVEEAIEHLELGLSLREKLFPAGSLVIGESLQALGEAHAAAGGRARAREFLGRTLVTREAALPASSLAIARTLRALGEVQVADGELEAGRAALRRAVDIFAARGAEDFELAGGRFALAQALGHADGDELAREALATLQARGPGFAREAAEVATWLSGQAG